MFGDDEHRNHRQRQHLADGEHELPAVAHDLALALGHRLHDVGVAVGDVASERHAEKEADHHQQPNRRHEGLREGEHDEQDHGGQEHDPAADPIRQPAAEQGADQCATLGARSGQAQQQRVRVILVTDEHQHEGDRIQVPGFHQDGRHHQPADLVPARVVVGDEMADCAIHRRLLRHGYRHLRSFHSMVMTRAARFAGRLVRGAASVAAPTRTAGTSQ